MSNKYLRYFLMSAVVFIWGVIVFRIVYGLGAAKPPGARHAAAADPEMTIEVDTFTLYADYPDPFIPGKDTDDSVSKMGDGRTGDIGVKPGEGTVKGGNVAAAGTASAGAPALTKETLAGLIQYKGLFGNPRKKNAIAIVVIHGKGAIVREKDRVEGIYIKKIGKEALQVVYKGETFAVEKEQ